MVTSDIDRLFQLPLDEFTAARNALAKQRGAGGAAIRELTKPPVAAWAVNQLYWRDLAIYDALVSAANDLRKTNKAVLGGRSGDLRAAGRAHDQALDRALKATTSILSEAGHPASDVTRQAVVSTLRALPAGDTPGRLTRTLQPGGFETLAGFPIARGPRKPEPARALAQKTPAGKAKVKDAKEEARLKKEAAAAAEALRKAEQVARREEFERARTAREADKARAAVERAREAVVRAQEVLGAAERAAKAAEMARERALRPKP